MPLPVSGLELNDLGSLPTQTTRCSFRLCLTKLFLSVHLDQPRLVS